MGSTANGITPSEGDQDHESIVIAIVGGGIAGLCLALGLLNQAPHLNIHIFEAAPQFAEIGAGVAFGINAQRALWELDARLGERYSKLKTSNVDFNVDISRADEGLRRKQTYLRLLMGMDHATNPDFKAGKEICEIFCEGGFSSVHRARFLEELVDLLPNHVRTKCVTFNARLVKIEDEVSAHGHVGAKLTFEDGRISTADAVIGCDGIRSQLRRVLLGDNSNPVFTGKYAYRGLIPMDNAAAQLGDRSARNAHHRLGYDGHVLTFPIDKGNTMNVVAFRTKKDGIWPNAADWIEPTNKEAMIDDFKGWGDEVLNILGMMERCDKWALFDHPAADTYYKRGQICLIGDAAHGSTPHQGSGAGMAVEDALVISAVLSRVRQRSDLEKAFSTFEMLRKKRTQHLVRCSREQAAIYEFQAPETRDDVEKIARVLLSRWDWIWDHDLASELAEAKASMDP